MDLSVITVTHNAGDHILPQIQSVSRGAKNISIEQWVVDNGSIDGTSGFVEKEFPNIHLIKNGHNNGFGHANNQAAALSKGEFILFLNPDMRVREGSLDIIVAWMKSRPEVGIASCKLVNEDGKFADKAKPRRFPRLFDQIMILLKLPHLCPRIINKYLYSDFNPEVEQSVDTVRGSFMLMRRSLYNKLGWAFDPRYFIWFEDVDICRECKKSGMKVVYTPIITCVDYVGQTFKKMPAMWKQINFTKSMLIYFQKWESWHSWIWIAAFRPLAIALAFFSKK